MCPIFDSAAIIQSIAQIVFGDLYVSKKFKYGRYDFPYDQIIDDTAVGQLTGAIRLRIITVASDWFIAQDQLLLMKSKVDNEAILVLSDRYPYFDDLESAAKIRKYVKSRNVAQLPEAIQHIIRGKQQQATAYEKTAREHIAAAILEARAFIAGEPMSVKGSSVKDKFETALSNLVESVYTKLGCIRRFFDSDVQIVEILTNSNKQLTLGGAVALDNPEAVAEVESFLELRRHQMMTPTMGEIQRRFSGIPWGWREIDIAATIASLISAQKVSLQYAGSTIRPDDAHMPDYLRRKNEIDKAKVVQRVVVPPEVLKKARECLKEFFNTMDLPSDEDALINYVIASFTDLREKLQSLLSREYAGRAYPDRAAVENGIKLCGDLLSQKKDNTALLKKLLDMEADFLDHNEDMISVNAFFKNQRPIFDSAAAMVSRLKTETDYLQAEKEATAALTQIKAILGMPKPYKRIAELPMLMQSVESSYGQLMALKKQDVIAEVEAAMGEIHQTANMDEPRQRDIVIEADAALEKKKSAADAAETLTQLDAIKPQIDSLRMQYIKKLMTRDERKNIATATRSSICYTTKLQTEADIDEYLAEIREKLVGLLKGHDGLHII